VRIVYLNPSGKLGGAETSLRELLSSVRAAVPDWKLCLVLGEDGPLAAAARECGVETVLAPFPPALACLGDSQRKPLWVLASLIKAMPGILRYKRNLARILKREQPDIIHTNGLKMHLLGAWARSGSPLVWHIHDYVSTRQLMSRMLRVFEKDCTLAIVNSKSVARDLGTLMPRLKIVPVYNAIDLKRFSPAGPRLDLDAASGLSPAEPGTLRVGLVATFARWKGHKTFLAALARLSPDLAVRGYIIGGPIYQTEGSQWSVLELQQEADRLGLKNRIGFTGFLHDTPAAMRSLDIVVHASTQPEPFGMVIIEGMASGTAVIVSAAGGAAELFEEGENALSHPPGDAVALARQIERLAESGELRRKLGLAGRETAERLYPGSRMAGEVVALYQEIGSQKAGTERGSVARSVPVASE
jgi:glycosyltransferase involved in cell wall biosynthesis